MFLPALSARIGAHSQTRRLELRIAEPAHATSPELRLISRNRFRLPRLRDKIGMIPMEPASLVMERKMLYGIKQRAERLALDGQDGPGAPEAVR